MYYHGSLIPTPQRREVKDIIKDQIEKCIKNENNIIDYFMGFFSPDLHIKELKEVLNESFPEYLKMLETIILLK